MILLKKLLTILIISNNTSVLYINKFLLICIADRAIESLMLHYLLYPNSFGCEFNFLKHLFYVKVLYSFFGPPAKVSPITIYWFKLLSNHSLMQNSNIFKKLFHPKIISIVLINYSLSSPVEDLSLIIQTTTVIFHLRT